MTQAFKETFRLLDADNDGLISRHELHALFAKIGRTVTDRDIDFMLLELGTPGRGGLSFDEFMGMLGDWLSTKTSQDIVGEVYETLQNANGKVMLSDLRNVLASFGESLTDEEFAELLKNIEVGPDESLTLEAFTRVLSKDDSAPGANK
eukprot:Amastigsp_a678767_45.p4 type:complete len:149 gc:universal Amastigsp_a678767_45:32-478(+)